MLPELAEVGAFARKGARSQLWVGFTRLAGEGARDGDFCRARQHLEHHRIVETQWNGVESGRAQRLEDHTVDAVVANTERRDQKLDLQASARRNRTAAWGHLDLQVR